VLTTKKVKSSGEGKGNADADSRIFIRLDCHFTVFVSQTFTLPLYVYTAKKGDSISRMQCYRIRCSPNGTRNDKDAYLLLCPDKPGKKRGATHHGIEVNGAMHDGIVDAMPPHGVPESKLVYVDDGATALVIARLKNQPGYASICEQREDKTWEETGSTVRFKVGALAEVGEQRLLAARKCWKDKQSAMLQRAENRARKEQEREARRAMAQEDKRQQCYDGQRTGHERNRSVRRAKPRHRRTSSSNIITGRKKEGTKGTDAYQRA
jgi:hypothetical protein